MIQYAPTSLESARWLLDIKAVNFRPKNPYTLTAGWVSPVYIDCRWIISFPEARRRIIKLAVELLRREGNLDVTDLVAGGETAGIPYAAWIAEATNKPMLYVRKKPKGFGRNAQIEGALREGQRVILIEDLATDGGSKINFVRALRDAGAEISDIFVVFFYGVFPNALNAIEEIGVNLHYLCSWQDVLKVAEEDQYFSKNSIKEVREFLMDPTGWSKARGGRGS
tara:strand:+ start:63 stop:734 length:672 start_codon:yes stop_codon:yes gene_type:complete